MGSGNSRPAPVRARTAAPVRAAAPASAIAIARAAVAPAPRPRIMNLSIGESADGSRTALQTNNGVSSSSATMFRRPDSLFSASTKAFIVPSIPFPMRFMTASGPKETPVAVMALYHPCPLRIENIQYDAALVLNDTSVFINDVNRVVVIIPLRGSNTPGRSGTFIGKVAPYIPGAPIPSSATPNPPPLPVATGNDWKLTDVLPITEVRRSGTSSFMPDVAGGFFTWSAVPYGVGSTGISYVMMKNPVDISPTDLQSIRSLPITPPEQAIPAPDNTWTTGLPKPIFYKMPIVLPGRPTPRGTSGTGASAAAGDVVGCGSSSTREHFAPGCDPLQHIGQPSGTFRLDSGQVIAMLSSLVGILAIVIAVYFALKYARGRTDGGPIGQFSEWLGRAMSRAAAPAAAVATAATAAVSSAPPPVVDDTVTMTENPMRRPRPAPAAAPALTEDQTRQALAAAPAAPAAPVSAERGLDTYRASRPPRSRASSVGSRSRANSVVSPDDVTLSPAQVEQAVAANPAAGTGILPGSEVGTAPEAPVRRRNLRREDSEYLELEAADEAAKKAAEAVEQAAEEARLQAQDEAVKAESKVRNLEVKRLEADVARRSAAFAANKKTAEAALARVQKLKEAQDAAKAQAKEAEKVVDQATAAKKEVTKRPYSASSVWSKLKKIEPPRAASTEAAVNAAQALAPPAPGRRISDILAPKRFKSARATAAPKSPAAAEPPAPPAKPIDARRPVEGKVSIDLLKNRLKTGSKYGGKNTRKTYHR